MNEIRSGIEQASDEELEADADALVDAALKGDPEALQVLMESGVLDDDLDADCETEDEPARMEIRVPGQDGMPSQHDIARTVLRPTLQAALTSNRLLRSSGIVGDGLNLQALIDALGEQVKLVTDGDLNRGEGMLASQAHTLDAIFNHLARKAMSAEYLNQFEAYLKLGLRAQAQCRATWEAISEIQNPRVAGYVKQANIAHNQQVNNEPQSLSTDQAAFHGPVRSGRGRYRAVRRRRHPGSEPGTRRNNCRPLCGEPEEQPPRRSSVMHLANLANEP